MNITWRKSSYSGGINDNACVELVDRIKRHGASV